MTPEYRNLFTSVLPGFQPAANDPAEAPPVFETREWPREAVQPAKDVEILSAESFCSNALPSEPSREDVSAAVPPQEPVELTAETPQETAALPKMASPAFVFIPPEVSRSEPTTISALRPARNSPASRRSDRLAARHYAFTAAACIATAIATFFGTTAWRTQTQTRQVVVASAAAAARPQSGVKRTADVKSVGVPKRQPLLSPDPLAGLGETLGSELPVEEPPLPAPVDAKNAPVSRPVWPLPDSLKPADAPKTTTAKRTVRSRRARVRSRRPRIESTQRPRRRTAVRRARRVVGSSVIRPTLSR